MITPDELYDKAQRLYPKAIEAWLGGDASFFPQSIRANTDLPDDHVEAIRQVDAIRQGSKEKAGNGYSIDWQARKLRKHGTQRLPNGFFVESLSDLLGWIGKQAEFRRLERSFRVIRERCPQLIEWSVRNWRRLLEVESYLDDLLLVTIYLRDHPRPNCFPRELPLPVSTKLIEQNSRLLAEWLDTVLPDIAIDHNFSRDKFAKRYGFRERSAHYLVRLLDESLTIELQCPGTEFSLPLETISRLQVNDTRVIIVENKTNLLTLPTQLRTIAMGGLGYSIAMFFDIAWLATNELYYWGDLDVDGFRILANLRDRFPQTQSLMMDTVTLQKFRSAITSGNQAMFDCPTCLNEDEREAFEACCLHNWRLEQEHIPQSHVVEILRHKFGM